MNGHRGKGQRGSAYLASGTLAGARGLPSLSEALRLEKERDDRAEAGWRDDAAAPSAGGRRTDRWSSSSSDDVPGTRILQVWVVWCEWCGLGWEVSHEAHKGGQLAGES